MFEFFDQPSNRWFAGGCVGLLATIATTVIATKKYGLKVDEVKEAKGAVTRKDKLRIGAEAAALPTLAAGLTLYCFGKSKQLDLESITAWSTGYSVLETGYKALKNTVNNELGVEKAKEIAQKTDLAISEAHSKLDNSLKAPIVGHPVSGAYLCEDGYSHVQWYSNEDEIERINKKLIDRLFNTREPVTLNDIWYEFGILNHMSEADKITGARFGVEPPSAYIISKDNFDLFTYTRDTDNMSRMLKLIVNYDVVNIEDWR
jgi:hypothetical protein